MTSTSIRNSVFVGIAGLSIAGAAAGCAPSSLATPVQTTETTATAQSSAGASAATPSAGAQIAQTSGYKDGTYSADGMYTSPNGQETVGVELTLKGGAVSAVNITVHPSNPNTKKFQGQFASGIATQIVGKKLDDLNVSNVSGSSLTSGGFNQAVEAIKSQAS